ncbi:MAG TPA: urea transporter [Kaistia sp.]|nr:urea transporter [Kaistia sp.]
MARFVEAFERVAAASPRVRFVDVALRGLGQVMFQDNPLTGLFFLLAIIWGAGATGQPFVAIGGVLGLLAATATALALGVDRVAWRAGLFGFNGVLTGLALATFLAPGRILIVFVILGAAMSVVVTLATQRWLAAHGIPGLTFPFVATSWLFLLASHGFAGVAGSGLPAGTVTAPAIVVASDPLRVVDFVGGVALSISQVFLKDSLVAALLFLAGLAVSSIPAALLALAGALIAVIVAHLAGAESDLVTGGLLGFSPVLTAVALGCTFASPTPRNLAYAAFATGITVIAQVAMNAALAPVALPAMTMPFVLITWLFLMARPEAAKR